MAIAQGQMLAPVESRGELIDVALAAIDDPTIVGLGTIVLGFVGLAAVIAARPERIDAVFRAISSLIG